MKTKADEPTPPMPLVGRCFHVFGENKKVQYQGIVRGMVNDSHVLVQYFEWIMGEPNTLEVVPIERMTVGATPNNRSAGSWQFYEDSKHMNNWYESHKGARDEH